MVNRFLSTLISVILITYVPATAATQPKAGEVCKRIGTTYISNTLKLECVKKNKKLVWQKTKVKTVTVPEVIQEESPQPSSSPKPPSSSQSQFNSKIASDNFQTVSLLAKNRSDAQYELNSIVNENVDTTIVKAIQSRYQLSINFWQEVLGNQKFYVIFGNNDDILWVKSQLEKISPYKYDDWYRNFTRNMPAAKCDSYSAGAYGGHKDFFLQSFTLYSNVCSSRVPIDDNFRTTVEHELTHAAQLGFTKNQNNLLPCWFKEGHAQYFGSLLGNVDNYNGFMKSRSYPFQRFNFQNFSEQLFRLDEKYDNFKCGTDGGYTVGSLAVENLLSISSHQIINQFMIDTGVLKNWRVAFHKNFGQEFEIWAANLKPEPV
jgi:hypothetical protein